MRRPLRIFLGTDDIAFCLSALAGGFRQLGHHVTTMVEVRARGAGDVPYDVVRGLELLRRVDYWKAPRLVAGAAYRLDVGPISRTVNALYTPRYLDHDLFVFFGRAWLPEGLLLPVLRRLGKRVAYYLLGSEARHVSAFSQEFGVSTVGWRRQFQVDSLEAKVRFLRYIELYADAIYSVPDQAGLQIRPYYHARIPIDVLSRLRCNVPDREVPLVVHAPSREDVKGTSFVLRSVDELRAKGVRFHFRMLSGVPRPEVLAALEEADILVDELLLHGPGVLAAEAMASGCAVATRTLARHADVFSAPVRNVTPETLTGVLQELIVDRAARVALARQGRAWALREFDPLAIAERVERHLLHGGTPEYVPNFFLGSFQLPAGARLSARARRLSMRVAREHRQDAVDLLASAAERGLVSED
jgi:hypothetical protein